ncbi:MAG: hypothetical protein A2Y94_08210 [Caldithrix sp. RBG_13_44_9]|nr:MAG: hypothetical protein A2Y94_08210 [Caldithrix sp. RBG_13_44_9]
MLISPFENSENTSFNLAEFREKIRQSWENYRPQKTNCLLISDAPPEDLENHFYLAEAKGPDPFFLSIMEILYPELKADYLNRRRPLNVRQEMLKKFQSDGFYFLEMLDIPLQYHQGFLSNAFSDMLARVKQTAEKTAAVILLKTTTFGAVYDNLKRVGYRRTAPFAVPFPDQNQTKEFEDKFRRALKYLKVLEK